ncbi:hypothetical protein ISS37_00195 [candidate division KSB1 bacterium]|nr:hypothetical protein [candidate division KSB1 bacterium]
MMRVLIDTRLWGLALKVPYYDDKDPVKEYALQADHFIRERLEQDLICVTTQLLAEIHHVLTTRGRKLPSSDAEVVVKEILDSERSIFRNPNKDTILQALRLSTKCDIHIWDFLLVLPFKGELDRIYTMDPHFRECKHLQVAPVENPLGVWRLEGALLGKN